MDVLRLAMLAAIVKARTVAPAFEHRARNFRSQSDSGQRLWKNVRIKREIDE